MFHEQLLQSFYREQNLKIGKKIGFCFLSYQDSRKKPVNFLKPLEGAGGLLEISIEVGSNIFRKCCCLNRGNAVVLFNGFRKKS